MPILKAIGKNKSKKKGSTKQTLAGMKAVLNYIARAGREEQIYKAFGMGLNDNVDKANNTIIFNKKTHNKVDNNLYKHYALSFPKGFDNLEIIEKITREFVQKELVDKGFLCYVGIHIDKDHYHSHILVDTVNFNTGYKLHQLDNADMKKARYKDKILPEHEISLEHLKNSMEEIALEYGVPSPERNKDKSKSINIGKMSKYKALEKKNSWRNYIAKTWEKVILETTTTMENLEQKLKEKGIYFNRFNPTNKTLTLATEYTVGEEKKVGKIRLSKLETEEDYRFQATPNLYNWDNFIKILEKNKEKDQVEELKIEDLENIFNELEKDAELEKEFTKEIEEVKIELDKVKEYNTLPMITMNCREFYSKVITFFKEFEEHKKDYKDLEELKNLKSDNGWELILEYNTARISRLAKAEKEEKEKIEEEKERERERIELEKMRKNFEYNERHDRIRADEKAREQERIKLNKKIEDNKFIDIKEREIKPAAEEKEVEKTTKRKEKDREYGE